MTHRAGLPAVSGPVVPGDLYDWDRMVELLAASAPVVPARSEPVYHNMTYGHLLGEILRRAAGAATLSDLLQADLCAPLQADFRLGLTPEEAALAAHLTQQDGGDPMAVLDGPDDTLFARSMRFFAGMDFNSTRWRRAVIGAGSGHATALGLARIYGETVRAGGLLADDARRLAATEQARSTGPDPILGMPMRFSLGLELSTPPGAGFRPVRADHRPLGRGRGHGAGRSADGPVFRLCHRKHGAGLAIVGPGAAPDRRSFPMTTADGHAFQPDPGAAEPTGQGQTMTIDPHARRRLRHRNCRHRRRGWVGRADRRPCPAGRRCRGDGAGTRRQAARQHQHVAGLSLRGRHHRATRRRDRRYA